jgi:cytochrome c oxidase subunit IV
VDFSLSAALSHWRALPGSRALMSEHIVSVKLYLGIFVALLCLTALTTGVAYIDLGAFNTVAALAIAVVKMLLVILFFMHVKYSGRLIQVFILAGALFLAILITLTLADELTRHWSPTPTGWNTLVPWLSRFF